MTNSNILIAIFIGVVLVIIVYYLNQNNDQPIRNHGTIDSNQNIQNTAQYKPYGAEAGINNAGNLVKNKQNTISNSIVDDLVSQYDHKQLYKKYNKPNKMVSASDPMSSEYGSFTEYEKKRHIEVPDPEYPYEENSDPNEFVYKKKKFVRRTPEDVNDLYDINKMLPQEIEDEWFDVVPLMGTKKIKGTSLIHPKVHMGQNTVSGSLRNPTHDIRGDIPNPKIPVSPWGNSTIEPDTNIRGLC